MCAVSTMKPALKLTQASAGLQVVRQSEPSTLAHLPHASCRCGVRLLVEREYPWFLETYDAFPENIMRSDAVRKPTVHASRT